MKKCTKCGETKELSEFSKKLTKLTPSCKSCIGVWGKEYYKKNKIKRLQYNKEYFEKNKTRLLEYHKKYNKKNKVKKAEEHKKWREDNKEQIKIKQKVYCKNNKEKIAKRRKKYYKNNKEKIIEKGRIYQRRRSKTDTLYKLTRNLRRRTSLAFKHKTWYKGVSTEQLLGVSFEIAKKHLEKQFTKGMSWDNYGEWHIDHIIPLASAPNEIELRKLCHYTNLQPLWAFDNISKGAKTPEVQIQLRI